MAKLLLARSYNKFPTIWGDPDSTKNRIFLDNYGYDYNTLAPRFVEHWYWQSKANLWTFSNTVDFDNWGPVQIGYMDGNAWSDADASIWSMPGIFNLWQVSLDYNNYRCTRVWRTSLGRTIATYPRTGTTNDQYGDWWMGPDMTQRSLSWCTNNTAMYAHCWEHVEPITFFASSWSYSSNTITVNRTAHGFFVGDTVTITGATATSNAPNGTYVIVTRPDVNSFTYTVGNVPTGTAAGSMSVTGTTYRAYGVESERDVGMKTTILYGHNYTYGDNDGTAAIGRPTNTSLNTGGWKFWLGIDSSQQFAWFVTVKQASGAGSTNCPYSVQKYQLAGGPGTETSVLGDSAPTGATTNLIQQMPSNLVTTWGSTVRKVFYSSHYNATQLQPFRVVWDTTAQSINTTDCTMIYPGTGGFTTYSDRPTANTWNTAGYNVYWTKGHQFTKAGTTNTNFITFCSQDGYIYSNQNRFPSYKSRTWLTYSIGQSTADDQLTFHSGFNFLTTNDYPLSWVPYSTNGNKLAIFSTNGTSIISFNGSSFVATSWTYAQQGGQTLITVTKTAHGLSVGNQITTSGATAGANAPNGVYRVYDVPTADTFQYVVNSLTSGIPTGSAGGTMTVTLGWQVTTTSPVRARGYGTDSLGRLWVTARTPAIGRVEIHMINDTVPATINIQLQTPVSGTTTKYVYTGSTINTFLLVDAYDVSGSRLASTLTLTISGNSMTFTGGATSTTVTTNTSTNALVAVAINGAGQSSVTASVNI